MDEQTYIARAQWLVLAGSALLLLLLLGAWIMEGTGRDWKRHQREYGRLVAGNADSLQGQDPVGMEKGIFQLELAHFNRVDRCVTCHQGMENPRMEGADQPHAMHPGTYLADHPTRQYGCTICHGGQGRALDKKDAFGQLPETHWPYPMLEQPFIQSSCGHCHLSIFSGDDPAGNGRTTGMEVFLKGKELFSAEGCLGCHRARGVGGILGPDLTEQGEKTKHEYSFQNVEGEQTVSNWLKAHFRDPEMVSPGSRMLRINLPEDELDALATFVMGLARPGIPIDYLTPAALNEFKGIRDPMEGGTCFTTLCSACHGKQGSGKSYREYKTGIPAVGNRDFRRVASGMFIRFTLQKGRSTRQMGSWEEAISGITEPELDAVIRHLKQEERPALGELLERYEGSFSGGGSSAGPGSSGKDLFLRRCAACHGEEGRGGVAVALNQEGFLGRAGNRFILQTLIHGRENTAMPGWPHLENHELTGLLALIRSWHGTPGSREPMDFPATDTEEGALKYHFLCSRCHGEHGEGETGPAIINKDFLQAADDRFLYETISEGRPHTAMFGWSTDVYDQERLDADGIAGIVGYMRKTAAEPVAYIYPGTNPGDGRAGRRIFMEHCAECHGEAGGGPDGPALNNQELLSAASNGYLMATITLGREGTEMPSWGYGDGSHPALTGVQRQDLVAYIRSWQRIGIRF